MLRSPIDTSAPLMARSDAPFPAAHLGFALLVPLLWGLSFVTARYSVDAFPPFALVALRFAVVAALLLAFVRPVPRAQWGPLLAISVVGGGIHWSLVFAALARADAGAVVAAYQISTPLTVVFAALLLRERMRAWDMASLIVSIAGVAALGGGALAPVALALVVGAAAANALGNTLVRRFGPFEPWSLNAWTSLLIVPQAAAFSVFVEDRQLDAFAAASPAAWAAATYTAIGGSLIGYGLWYALLERRPAASVAPFLLLTPVFGILLGVLLLGERPGAQLLIGCSLLLIALVLSVVGQRSASRRARRSTDPAIDLKEERHA